MEDTRRNEGAPRAVTALLQRSAVLSAIDVVELQREAGNRAVTAALQPAPPVRQPGGPDKIPEHGPEVRPELQARLPGLLGALSDAQLDQWQRVVDFHTIAPKVRRAKDAVEEEHKLQGQFRFDDPGYRRKMRKLDAAIPKTTASDEKLSVDLRRLLADDVMEPPAFDVDAELAFRQWAVDQLAKNPVQLDLRPTASWYQALGQWPMSVRNTKGFVTAENLRHQFPNEYHHWVSHRPLIAKLEQALDESQQVFNEVVPEHLSRSAKNDYKGRPGPFWARHFSELFGPGRAPYPTVRIWDRPKALLAQARPLLDGRRMELAVPIIAMAEQATAESAQRFLAYEERVMAGAGTVVKWLDRLKTAGSVAAGVASGGLGLTGAALVAGGYTLVQEGAGRLSEMAHGQREHFGVASLIEEAGVSAVMSMMGGALQSRFQVAFKARLDKVPGMAGNAIADIGASAAAAGTSSVYTTAAELAIKSIIDGKAMPRSAAEFADLIVDNALQNVAMDVGLNKVNSRAGREYEAWKAGRAKPAVSVPAAPGARPAAKDSPVKPDPAGSAARTMPETSVRALLKEGGGWERLRVELETGTGLGAGMMPAERQSLAARFEAHREVTARNVGSVFGGEVVITGTTDGRQIEVRFTGPDAPEHAKQAQDYLDAKSPGWAEQTAVKLTTPAVPESSRSNRAQAAQKALTYKLTDSAVHLAKGLVPIYDQWVTLGTPEARFEAMLAVVNGPLVAAGAPALLPHFLENAKAHESGTLDFREWDLKINRDLLAVRNPTPEQFAAACDTMAHEARHALQWFRMARLHPEAVRGRIDPQAMKAAEQANQGLRRAERFVPGQQKHQDAQAYFDSVYGTGEAERARIYEDQRNRLVQCDVAYDELQRTMGLPINDPQRRAAEEQYRQAQERYETAHEAYENLAEEVDARRHGQTTAEAVGRLMRSMDQARAGQRDAYARYRAAEEAALMSRHRVPLEERKAAREDAFRRYEAADAVVKRLEAQLRTQPGKGGRTP